MIVITTQCFAPKIGGIEALMTGMASAMTKAGKNVVVLADGKKEADDDQREYEIIRFSGWKPMRRRQKAYYLKRIAKKYKIEAIYADSWKSIEYLGNIKVKIISLAHGTEIPKKYFDKENSYFNLKKRRIINSYQNCTLIAANSTYTRDLMIASLKIKSQKIKIIHPGIDIYQEFIKDRDREIVSSIIGNSSPIITTLARVEKRKGHKFVINALSKLKYEFPKMKYLIAGRGPYLNEVKKHVKNLKLEDFVIFLGWITEPEKSLVLRNSDLFVMTPTQEGESIEGFGMVFIDAAFHGIASIGTKSGGISDAIVHNKTGLICDEGDQDKITFHIGKLLRNTKLRHELGNNGKIRAKKNYSWDKKIIEYLNL